MQDGLGVVAVAVHLRDALDDRELSPDISAVAAAILDGHRRPIASISISMPALRMTDDLWDRYGTMVAGAARQISAALGHDSAYAPVATRS